MSIFPFMKTSLAMWGTIAADRTTILFASMCSGTRVLFAATEWALILVRWSRHDTTLREFLMERRKRRALLSEAEVIQMSLQIHSALHYLHSHSIIHRDLRLDNIFVWGDGTSGAPLVMVGGFDGMDALAAGTSHTPSLIMLVSEIRFSAQERTIPSKASTRTSSVPQTSWCA